MSHDETAADRLAASDPALMITEDELARSRERSLAFINSDVTQIAVGGSIRDFHRPPAKRHWGRLAGAALAAAAVAASVLVASNMASEPVNVATGPTVSEITAVPAPPAGPAEEIYKAADEVLVLQALPNPAKQGSPEGLGLEPVNVIQILKGSRPLGKATIDASSIQDPGTWRQTNAVAPMTYLAFIKHGAEGVGQLINDPLALVEIMNLRTVTFADPIFQQPVDLGADLASRISIRPAGDVPLSTYAAAAPASSSVDMLNGQGRSLDRTLDGIVRGQVTATQACFTFQTSTEKVLLRWPAGYTAMTRLLPASPEGEFRIDGPSASSRAVVLNAWGLVYAYDGQPWPLINGTRTNEQATCNGETLPVFNIQPTGGEGTSPFRNSRGISGPNT